MRTPLRSLAPILVPIAMLSACGDAVADDAGNERILDKARIELPQGGLHGIPVGDFAPPILMDAQGMLSYEGKSIAGADLETVFAQQREARLTDPSLIIDPQTPFAMIVSQLPAFSEQQGFELVWEGDVPQVPRADYAGLDVFVAQGFAGTVTENEVGLRVGYSAEADQCALVLNGKVVSSEEAYDQAFMTLDELVVREGGPEVVVGDPDLLNSIVARIQAEADTPWRCFGGAIRAVQGAGWPAIHFEVVGD